MRLAEEDNSSDPQPSNNGSSSSSRHPPLPPHARLNWSSDLSDPAARAAALDELARHRPSPPPPGSEHHPEINEIRRRRHFIRARERALSLREAQRLGRDQTIEMERAAGRWMNGEPGAGVKTAGLVMSGDGSRFWAGSEKGVWEFDINMLERRSMASYEMR